MFGPRRVGIRCIFYICLSCFYSLVPKRHEFVQFGHLSHCQRILHYANCAKRSAKEADILRNVAITVAPDTNNYTILFMGQRKNKKKYYYTKCVKQYKFFWVLKENLLHAMAFSEIIWWFLVRIKK